jgi:hypothetical protein
MSEALCILTLFHQNELIFTDFKLEKLLGPPTASSNSLILAVCFRSASIRFIADFR